MYEDPSLANDSSQAVEQIVDNDSIGEDSTVVSGLGSVEEPVRLPVVEADEITGLNILKRLVEYMRTTWIESAQFPPSS